MISDKATVGLVLAAMVAIAGCSVAPSDGGGIEVSGPDGDDSVTIDGPSGTDSPTTTAERQESATDSATPDETNEATTGAPSTDARDDTTKHSDEDAAEDTREETTDTSSTTPTPSPTASGGDSDGDSASSEDGNESDDATDDANEGTPSEDDTDEQRSTVKQCGENSTVRIYESAQIVDHDANQTYVDFEVINDGTATAANVTVEVVAEDPDGAITEAVTVGRIAPGATKVGTVTVPGTHDDGEVNPYLLNCSVES